MIRYELVEKQKGGEKVLGRYDTPGGAEGQKDILERLWTKLKLSHGELVIREVRA